MVTEAGVRLRDQEKGGHTGRVRVGDQEQGGHTGKGGGRGPGTRWSHR